MYCLFRNYRDKEVGRLNNVIERLQEKTHAHVTAMNKELRASNAKCAAQSERLAVMGERLRVAESAVISVGEHRGSTARAALPHLTSFEGAFGEMEGLRHAKERAAALEAENQALRSSLKKAAVCSPSADGDADDDLEGSPQPGELVV